MTIEEKLAEFATKSTHLEMDARLWRPIESNEEQLYKFYEARKKVDMIYEKTMVEGYLKKEPESKSFFGTRYERYVTLDHISCEMRICKGREHDEQKNGKVINYTQIHSITQMSRTQLARFDAMTGGEPPRWSHKFTLHTRDRDYTFYAE